MIVSDIPRVPLLYRLNTRSILPTTAIQPPWMRRALYTIPQQSSQKLNPGHRDTMGDQTWQSGEEHPFSRQSLAQLLSNKIPSIRVPQFLTKDECQRLWDIVKTHPIGAYEGVFPPIGSIGITQFEHKEDKDTYFKRVPGSRDLQRRFDGELDLDIVNRVRKLLQSHIDLAVRIATEGDREYFAGILRCINSAALIHADYGPYDAPSWKIGCISAQITWNVLLSEVDGGETVVYNRFWEGPIDDTAYKKQNSYGYAPSVVDSRLVKVLKAVQGDLTLFNSRNFHEVKAVDQPQIQSRFTMSSFVGLLPDHAPGGPALIMWS